jgi:agarase
MATSRAPLSAVRRAVRTVFLIAALAGSGGAAAAQDLDQYGGYRDQPGAPTGHFRVEKRGSRYVFATPEGNAFWMRAVYGIDITDGGSAYVSALKAKYGEAFWEPFVQNAVRRLRSWGFNTIGEYSSNYALPVVSYYRGWSNPEKMPFIRLIQPSYYGHLHPWRVKDIQYGVKAAVTPGLWYAEGFPDVFDPAFAAAAAHLARAAEQFADGTALRSPWLIGTTVDDRDYLFGFGAQRVHGGWHPHLGWLAMATAATQASNSRIYYGATRGITYLDTKVYTKHALRDFLRRRHVTLAHLNASWGSTYTSWDSTPDRRGVLDEDGSSPWLGRDFYSMSDATPGVRNDLDRFVGRIAKRYFSVVTAAVRAVSPGKLVFSPAAISTRSHPRVLKQAGRHCDVVQVEGQQDTTADFVRAFQYAKKPMYIWTTAMSQADSGFDPADGWAVLDFPTQEARGAGYAGYVRRALDVRATVPEAVHPIVGLDWWAYVDKVVGGESANFGLVDIGDRAYDGLENPLYGDFLSGVRGANAGVRDAIRH